MSIVVLVAVSQIDMLGSVIEHRSGTALDVAIEVHSSHGSRMRLRRCQKSPDHILGRTCAPAPPTALVISVVAQSRLASQLGVRLPRQSGLLGRSFQTGSVRSRPPMPMAFGPFAIAPAWSNCPEG